MLPYLVKLSLSFTVAALVAGRGFRRALRRRPRRIQNGPWQASVSSGRRRAGIYSRAFAARHEPLGLQRSEALYFVAYTDSDGNKLRRGCTYSLSGQDPDTRWWSVAAYNNNTLIPNPRHRYSYSMTTVLRGADGRWTIRFSPREAGGNWLPSATEEGELKLVLRCYGPGAELLANPAAARLPQIVAGTSR